ncbi:MAG: sugar phosphate isomerase/epimerase [Tenericutes bacterium HGW-Tenericutes-6]|jgi:sugar phosphate isomerase/epimerase|nr:MAG: sugar phosphate isomerase/epimerase [Tenericutes bacterium HGW-Tenericutes-6]
MLKLGIRAHDIGRMTPFELAEEAKSFGFDGVQLVFKKALTHPVNFNNLNEIKNAFKKPKIMMLGAYFNMVHPDLKVVTDGIDYFKKHLEISYALGAKYVGTETGSLMGSPWGYVNENHAPKTLEKVIEIVKDLSRTAEKYHAYIALEGAYAHVAYSPKIMKKIIDQVQSPNLKVTVDLFNFLHIGNYKKRMAIFDEAISLLKDHIVIFHLKDFIVDHDALVQVGLGQGLMDYKTIIKKIKESCPNAYLIFEGVVGDDIKTSYKLIKKLLKE